MLKSLAKYNNFALLVMRIGLGIMMIMHGYPKLIGGTEKWEKIGGAMADLGVTFMPVLWGFMASFAEAVGGLLIVLGLFFRPAALLILVTMIVAALKHINAGDGITGASHAVELAFVFFGLFIIGPGKFSFDKK